MNDREIGEIRRRIRPEKNNIVHILGCYVDERREIISKFSLPLGLLMENESEKYLALLKKVLSGSLGRNLINMEFSTEQVMNGEEHALLMRLRDSALEDEQILDEFYGKIIGSLVIEGKYLILCAFEKYDVRSRSKNDEEMDDDSTEMFRYFLCSICPVKATKPLLCYTPAENSFHERALDWAVSAPEIGFMFPCFNERSSDIYNVLYYTRDAAENHDELIDALFKVSPPKPAAAQKACFEETLSECLAEECSLDVVQEVNTKLSELLDKHKESKEPEPLTVTARQVSRLLEDSGVSEQCAEQFTEHLEEHFGKDAEINAQNLIDRKRLDLKTPDVVIRVNPERGDLIETRVINGRKYILICAEGDVELNGVNISIKDEEDSDSQ